MSSPEKKRYLEKVDRHQFRADAAELKRNTIIEFHGQPTRWIETSDFPVDDPWSQHTRRVISGIRAQGGFRSDLFEAGVGDGRNIITAGAHLDGRKIVGVDLDGWRLDIARENFTNLKVPDERITLHEEDAVSFIKDLPDSQNLRGWAVACLPQAPGSETDNHADGFDPSLESLKNVRGLQLLGHDVDQVGLTLNAAFLKVLRGRVLSDSLNLLLTISDRVPPGIKRDLFEKTGWEVVGMYRTANPIQQDPDTGITFVENFDDGKRFFERNGGGVFESISAREAEKRRSASEQNGGRYSLNVYHHLSVYHLQPAPTKIYGYK